jgi:hypothetical protein
MLVAFFHTLLVGVSMAVIRPAVAVLVSVLDVLVLMHRVRVDVQHLSVLMLVNVGCLMGTGGHVAPIDG